jgi:hypothetical protein
MRLVNYGQGEIADRLTILALKILYGAEASKPVDHFERERNALLPQLNIKGSLQERLLELAAVNGALWHAEDALRTERDAANGGTSDDHPMAFTKAGQIAFRIQALNDRRSELITLINVNTGNHQGEEKLT